MLTLLKTEHAKLPIGDLAERVHVARAQSKRVLAAWLLFKPCVGDDEFKTRKSRIKSAADLLAPAREAHVLRKTIFKFAVGLGIRAQGELKHWLAEKLPEPNRATTRRRLAQSTRRLTEILDNWPSAAESSLVKKGLDRTRRKTKNAFRAASKKKSVKSFHHWRLWTKHLFLQMEMANENESLKPLRKLQQALGQHHDIAVAEKFLDHSEPLPRDLRKALLKRLARRRRALEKKCLKRGKKEFR